MDRLWFRIVKRHKAPNHLIVLALSNHGLYVVFEGPRLLTPKPVLEKFGEPEVIRRGAWQRAAKPYMVTDLGKAEREYDRLVASHQAGVTPSQSPF